MNKVNTPLDDFLYALSFFSSWEMKAHASIDLMTTFLKWNREISIRSSELTSQAKASGFNEVVVERLFNYLALVYARYQIPLDNN